MIALMLLHFLVKFPNAKGHIHHSTLSNMEELLPHRRSASRFQVATGSPFQDFLLCPFYNPIIQVNFHEMSIALQVNSKYKSFMVSFCIVMKKGPLNFLAEQSSTLWLVSIE